MVSKSAPQPICHKAMASKIVIFTRAAITKSNSATAGLQCTNTLSSILTHQITVFVGFSIMGCGFFPPHAYWSRP